MNECCLACWCMQTKDVVSNDAAENENGISFCREMSAAAQSQSLTSCCLHRAVAPPSPTPPHSKGRPLHSPCSVTPPAPVCSPACQLHPSASPPALLLAPIPLWTPAHRLRYLQAVPRVQRCPVLLCPHQSHHSHPHRPAREDGLWASHQCLHLIHPVLSL